MTTNATPSPGASESEREALLALCDALNEGESEECHIYMSELRQALRVSGLSLTADPAPVFGVTEEQVNRWAQLFHQESGLFLMGTDKPGVAKGLRAVLREAGLPVEGGAR